MLTGHGQRQGGRWESLVGLALGVLQVLQGTLGRLLDHDRACKSAH